VYLELFSQALVDADVDGSSVDVGQDLFATFYNLKVEPGTMAGTAPTLDVSLEESNDALTWSKIGAFTQVTTLEADCFQTLTLKSEKRYRRAVLDIDGGDDEVEGYVAPEYANVKVFISPASRH
jgi:hypothetical protein